MISLSIKEISTTKVRFLAFWKISIRQFFGWLGQYNWYGSIKYHRETMPTKSHRSMKKNNEVIEVWNFFYKSAFRLVGLDGKILDLHLQNFSGQYWGVKLTCIPNSSQIGQFLQKLSHSIEFRLVGWLGWLASSDFKKISRCKAY